MGTWLLVVATQRRTGVIGSVLVGGCAYWQGWCGFAGSAALGGLFYLGFSFGRQALKRLVYRRGLIKLTAEGITDGRPSFLKARYLSQFFFHTDFSCAIQELAQLLDRVDQRRFQETGLHQYNSHFTNLGILALAQNHTQHRQKVHQSWQNPDSLRETQYVSTFAHAAYGFVFCTALGLVSREKAKVILRASASVADADREGFLHVTNHSQKSLHFAHVSDYYDKLYSPKHYLVVDHVNKNILLAIRGTSGVSDAVTDLNCTLEPVPGTPGVWAHKGILLGAMNVLQECWDKIESSLQHHSDYNLIVTGHSLGGGTASLVALLLASNQLANESTPIKCYTFGAPPVLSHSCDEQRALFTSLFNHPNKLQFVHVVNGVDIVPRLSLWSFSRLVHKLDRLDALTPLGKLSFFARWKALWFGSLSVLSTKQRDAILAAIRLDDPSHTLGERSEAIVEGLWAEQNSFWTRHSVRLYHPKGTLLLTTPEGNYKTLEEIPPDVIVDFSARFFFDHLPSEYHASLMGKKDSLDVV